MEGIREALESYGFYLCRSKTEYIKCKFSEIRTRTDLEVKIRDHTIQVTLFRHLRYIILSNGENGM